MRGLLVAVLVVFLFLVVAQVGVALHVRTVLVAAAAEGARHGANADRTPEQGGLRAVEVVADSLSPEVAAGVRVTTGTPSTAAGLRTVEGDLATALATVLRVPRVELTCAGRTDSGVHARGQVVHADLDDVPEEVLEAIDVRPMADVAELVRLALAPAEETATVAAA